MSEGLGSLADAFAAAQEEVGSGEPAATETPLPGVEVESEAVPEQAVEGVTEQPKADLPEGVDPFPDLQELLDGLEPEEPQNSEQESVEPEVSAEEFWAQEIEVATSTGVQTLSLAEMRDGYLRQSDYTRKTQELATDRQVLRDAADFYAAFSDNPTEFAAALAAQAGLISEDSVPVKDIGPAKIQSEAEFEAEVQKRVEEALASDPRMQQAQIAATREMVNQTFDKIESDHGVSLSSTVRSTILEEATARGTADLELVFEALVNRATSARRAKKAAPSRPAAASPDSGGDGGQPVKVKSVKDAMKLAQAELVNQ